MHPALSETRFDRNVALLSAQFLKNRNWTINQCDFPVIDVTFNGSRPLRIRLKCDEWDELPPSAELLRPDGSAMTSTDIPGMIFHPGPHPDTNKPFICMRGFREYHTHPSHLDDHWDTYRGKDGMNLPGLLDQVSRGWRKAVGI